MHINFQLLDVVDRGSEMQPQLVENWIYFDAVTLTFPDLYYLILCFNIYCFYYPVAVLLWINTPLSRV